MQNMLMGRYIPGDSIIHRMDPRSKLLVMIAFVVIIFLAHDWLGYLLLVLYTLAGVLLSKISVSYFLKGLRPMIGLILFTVIFQMLFTNGQHVIFSLWFIKISTESLINAVYIFFRFVLIIFMSTILTLTTPPLTLADGIEKGLGPLKKIKVPVHELGLMLSISLRFIPTLMDDTTMIMNAQKARGMDFGEGNFVCRPFKQDLQNGSTGGEKWGPDPQRSYAFSSRRSADACGTSWKLLCSQCTGRRKGKRTQTFRGCAF